MCDIFALYNCFSVRFVSFTPICYQCLPISIILPYSNWPRKSCLKNQKKQTPQFKCPTGDFFDKASCVFGWCKCMILDFSSYPAGYLMCCDSVFFCRRAFALQCCHQLSVAHRLVVTNCNYSWANQLLNNSHFKLICCKIDFHALLLYLMTKASSFILTFVPQKWYKVRVS